MSHPARGGAIPFNKPTVVGRELEYVGQAVASGQLAGDGPFTFRVQALLQQILGVPRALLTPSGTHALEMAAILIDLAPTDEVIMPSFTFVSTANGFVSRGARPVFVDIREDTLNMDERLVEHAIGGRTRALVPVHYGGIACEMDAILDVARRRSLLVIEDNAHGLLATYHGRPLGTFGTLAIQSFHETKNFTCGEGGALLINDPALIERAEIIREKGTDRSRSRRGLIDRYTWVDVGSSWLPADTQAAFLLAQLEAREQVQDRRRRIWLRYEAELRRWAEGSGTRLQVVPPDRESSFHLFPLLLSSPERGQALIAHLRARDIFAVFHYVPLHLSPMGQRFGARAGDCPVSESVSARLVRLPFFTALTDEEQGRVIDAVCAFD